LKNFVLIGAAGYIAPKHLTAIKETGNNLLAALDPHDSVGLLDNYFPHADFFTEFERFDRHCEKLQRSGRPIDYVSVCSPNYLHDAHIRFGLRIGADVVCEKPAVLNPWNADALMELEKETGKNVFVIHQLRLHPVIEGLRQKVISAGEGKKYMIDLNYITSRGNWYHHSWKGDTHKSGGITTNIGLHFFDILLWIFGDVKENSVFEYSAKKASGKLELERATVNWLLSIDEKNLPEKARLNNEKTFRQLKINGESLDFTNDFSDLHSLSYQQILNGSGIKLSETKKVIQLVAAMRK
jgi:UDP-N-acetyl-2-amino-2-deoxyglucuronate dehydrogenase